MSVSNKVLLSISIAVYVDAGNDGNGNPRRGWVIYDRDGGCLGFVDHGYMGEQALKELGLSSVPQTGSLTVTPGQYKSLKRLPPIPC